MRKLLRGDRDQQTGVRRGAVKRVAWTQIVQAVSAVWDWPWKELLCARGSGARETALFFGRHYGRLNLKELGQLAGGIHHNAVSIAIRRFTERLKGDSTLVAKFSLVQKALETLLAPVVPRPESAVAAPIPAPASIGSGINIHGHVAR
jgi:hypothetical protein